MDFLAAFGTNIGWLLGYVIPFLFVLSIVVFFHELGHFWVARRCGVKVETFSLGFGPEMGHFIDKHGTRWRIAVIPLGGYVKFFGDADAASSPDHEGARMMSAEERSMSYFHKPVAQRAAIVAAGPIANFILAIVIFAGVFMFWGKQVSPPRVDQVVAGSAAAAAGIVPGDVVVEIDGKRITSFSEMQRIVSASPDVRLNVTVERDGSRVTLTAVPKLREVRDPFGNTHRVGQLGITRTNNPGDIRYERYDPITATGLAVAETWYVVDRTFAYLYGVLIGRESIEQLSGPTGIAHVSGEIAAIGIVPLIMLAAVLSVSIGLLNLFPVPLLDGGHLMFYAIEWLRGRPLSQKTQEFGFRIGMALVLTLFVVATWNDILRFSRLAG